MNRTFLSMTVMGVCSLLGSFIAVHTMHGEPAQAQEGKAGAIKATEFSLVDKNGRVLIYMDGDEEGGRLSMLDVNGKVRMQASCGTNARISLLDDKGNPRYTVTQEADGSVMEFYADAKGKHRFVTSSKAGGEVMLMMGGPEGEQYVTLMAGPKEPTTLLMNSGGGKGQAMLFARDDQATMQLSCNKGQVLTAVLEDGRPVMALSKDDNLRLRAMLGEKGDPEFIFLNDKREATWRAGK